MWNKKKRTECVGECGREFVDVFLCYWDPSGEDEQPAGAPAFSVCHTDPAAANTSSLSMCVCLSLSMCSFSRSTGTRTPTWRTQPIWAMRPCEAGADWDGGKGTVKICVCSSWFINRYLTFVFTYTSEHFSVFPEPNFDGEHFFPLMSAKCHICCD